MERRDFLALPAAFAAGPAAQLVLREDGKAPISVDISVLKTEPGDILVVSAPGMISNETAARMKGVIESNFPHLKALVMGDGVTIEGVIRPPR